MKPANASAIPLDMEQARQELEAWRSTHRPRCHIPDSLWKRAAELASQHGLYLTSRTLRVDYMRLKKLVRPTSPERKSAELPRLIELMVPSLPVGRTSEWNRHPRTAFSFDSETPICCARAWKPFNKPLP
jgi:hypothetical protein